MRIILRMTVSTRVKIAMRMIMRMIVRLTVRIALWMTVKVEYEDAGMLVYCSN